MYNICILENNLPFMVPMLTSIFIAVRIKFKINYRCYGNCVIIFHSQELFHTCWLLSTSSNIFDHIKWSKNKFFTNEIIFPYMNPFLCKNGIWFSSREKVRDYLETGFIQQNFLNANKGLNGCLLSFLI